MNLTTAKMQALVDEIRRRLPGGKRDAWGLVLRFKTPEVEFLIGNHSYVAGSEMGWYDDLDPKPEPQSLAERLKAIQATWPAGTEHTLWDVFNVHLAETVDELKAQVAKLTKQRLPNAKHVPGEFNSIWNPPKGGPVLVRYGTGPDLLEAAKDVLSAMSLHPGSIQVLIAAKQVLEAAIAAEEARRKT